MVLCLYLLTPGCIVLHQRKSSVGDTNLQICEKVIQEEGWYWCCMICTLGSLKYLTFDADGAQSHSQPYHHNKHDYYGTILYGYNDRYISLLLCRNQWLIGNYRCRNKLRKQTKTAPQFCFSWLLAQFTFQILFTVKRATVIGNSDMHTTLL